MKSKTQFKFAPLLQDTITQYVSDLLDEGVAMLCSAWGTTLPEIATELQAPFMKLIKLPEMPNYPKTSVSIEQQTLI